MVGGETLEMYLSPPFPLSLHYTLMTIDRINVTREIGQTIDTTAAVVDLVRRSTPADMIGDGVPADTADLRRQTGPNMSMGLDLEEDTVLSLAGPLVMILGVEEERRGE